MFYKGVVATEADADAVFYQRLFQKIGAADEVHFVNAHNKQTLKKIIGPYQKLGIKFAMIADADVIRDKREFSDILQVTSDEQLKSQILQERETIMKHFQVRNKYAVLYELQAKTKELAEQPLIPETADPDDIASALFDFRSNLKKLRDDSDELSEFKKDGRASLPSELQPNFDNLWKCCASEGLFIVNVGELESWMVDYEMLTNILMEHQDRLQAKGMWFEDICDVVAKICFRNKQLCIGTVSSPMISNIVAYKFDESVISYCEKQGYRYSRYADDIYISGNSYIPESTEEFIKKCLCSYGFRMNISKTWFKSKKSRRKITGLIITDTGQVSVGMETRKKIKGMIYQCLVNGNGSPSKILGYLAYLKDVEPQTYNKFIIKYSTYCNGDVISVIRHSAQKSVAEVPPSDPSPDSNPSSTGVSLTVRV